MGELAVLTNAARQQANRYWGKYRGIVVDNADPEHRGRCRLMVASVLGEQTTEWAQAVLPYGGRADIGFVAVPPIGAMVVVEFLEGDISSPVWTGTLWRQGSEAPKEFATPKPTVKLLKTESGHLLALDDEAGQETVRLKSKAGALVELDQDGTLALTDGKGGTVRIDANAGEIHVADTNGNTLTLSSSGIVAKDASGNEISTAASGVKVSGATIEIKGTSVSVGGAGGEPLVKGASFMGIFNSHMHTCTAPGAPSSPPMVPMTPAALTKATVAS